MKSLPAIITIVLAFVLTFRLHIAVLMYPLAAVIFYFHVPLLYCQWKDSFPPLSSDPGVTRYKWYWVGTFLCWVAAVTFLSFLITHLLADIISSLYQHGIIFRRMHYIVLFLMLGCFAGTMLLEIERRKLDDDADLTHIRANHEKQGRLFSFEVLFIFLSIFLLKH